MRNSIKAYIHKGDKYYVAECLELPVVTQGESLDAVIHNLQEAIALHLEDEDPLNYDLVADPSIFVTLEIDSIAHAA